MEETCDPEDGGTTEECDSLCADIDELDDDCDEPLGESNDVCEALDALADGECEDGDDGDGDDDDDDGDDGDSDDGDEDEDGDDDDGESESGSAERSGADDEEPAALAPDVVSAACSTGGATGTGLAALPGLLLALVARRRK